MNSNSTSHAVAADGCFYSASIVEAWLHEKHGGDRQLLQQQLASLQLTCPDTACAQVLAFRRAHNFYVNGVAVPRSACFVHNDQSTCSQESREHALAKRMIVKFWRQVNFVVECKQCNMVQRVDVCNGFDHAIMDAREEVGWREYRLDVGFTTDDATVTGAVEICHTNPCSSAKVSDMTEHNLAWVEVAARDVIALEGAGSVRALRAGVTKCVACYLQQQHDALEIRSDQLSESLKQTDASVAQLREKTAALKRDNDDLQLRLTEIQEVYSDYVTAEQQHKELVTAYYQWRDRGLSVEFMREYALERKKRRNTVLDTWEKQKQMQRGRSTKTAADE